MTRFLFIALAVSLLSACPEAEGPAGPPHCEPPEELLIERALKRGFRAAAERDYITAEEGFREALDLGGEHPEARAGLRLMETLRRGAAPPERDGPSASPEAPDEEATP
jgi:hypothetical protein